METLKQLDSLASSLLKKLPELMQSGTLYANDLFVRFIQYSFIYESLYLVGAFLVAILMLTPLVVAYKYWDEIDYQIKVFSTFLIFPIVGFFAYCFIAFQQVLLLFQLYFLPELYIIEYFIK